MTRFASTLAAQLLGGTEVAIAVGRGLGRRQPRVGPRDAAQMCSNLLHIWQQVVAESWTRPSAGVPSWRRATEVPTLDSATRLAVGVSHSSGQPPGGAGDPPALRDGRTDQPFDVSRRRLEKRVKDTSKRIELPPARTGRPASHPRRYAPDELVRFDARIPARLAKQLYDVALTDGRSVTAVHADLLAAALECRGAAMD